jgi:hypothetical protein
MDEKVQEMQDSPQLLPPPGLEQALIEAMRPADLRERIKIRLAGGMTALQIYDRLPDALRAALEEGPENAVVARRQGIHVIEHGLYSLGQQSRVRRKNVTTAINLPGKGLRSINIDVYKLT